MEERYKAAWITWEKQPRNLSMAKLFDADFYEFNYATNNVKRYTKCLLNTLMVFNKSYSLVFVQNPSIVLAFFAVILGKVTNTPVVVDAHNAGVRPNEGQNRYLQTFNDWILRSASLAIVTNEKLRKFLQAKRIDAFCIPDPLPSVFASQVKEEKKYAFIICSWAVDEPIKLYLDVAKQTPNLEFRFTGNYKKYFAGIKEPLPENVQLLGFVSESRYINELANSSLAIDLTTRDDCLVCGAYESIALNVPVILTDNSVNRKLFENAAVYAQLTPESLKNAIDYALKDFSRGSIVSFRDAYHNKIEKSKLECLDELQKLHSWSVKRENKR